MTGNQSVTTTVRGSSLPPPEYGTVNTLTVNADDAPDSRT